MSSQQTYQSKLGKFSDGLKVLEIIPVYSPSSPELQLPSLQQLKNDVVTKNAAVVTAGTNLKELRNRRRFISFRSKEGDINCLENLFRNSRSYIAAELGKKSAAYSKINSILRKLHPTTSKKENPSPDAEPAKSRSKSEKSYQSLVGFAKDVITVLTGLGEAYNPSNDNIKIENILNVINELAGLNASVTEAEMAYNNAVNERKEIYTGELGISKVVPRIKKYLSSFEGGIHNPDYEAYVNAVR